MPMFVDEDGVLRIFCGEGDILIGYGPGVIALGQSSTQRPIGVLEEPIPIDSDDAVGPRVVLTFSNRASLLALFDAFLAADTLMLETTDEQPEAPAVASQPVPERVADEGEE